uniref:Uncharacterized protein n=1 Tax=Solanum lycopersicum TaxID=4081 RepID=A0A3Q7HMV5_SOLLC
MTFPKLENIGIREQLNLLGEESAFKEILSYWNSDETKETSHTNKENREKVRYPHTIGKTSFAIISRVTGKDHRGRVRLYRRGVTKTLLKHKRGGSGPSSQTVDDEMMQEKIKELEERMQQRMQ